MMPIVGIFAGVAVLSLGLFVFASGTGDSEDVPSTLSFVAVGVGTIVVLGPTCCM